MGDLGNTGGVVLAAIGVASAIGLAVFLERLLHFHRAQIDPAVFLEGILNVLKSRNLPEAVSLCDETPGPVPRIVRAAILHADEGPAALRQAVEEAGLAEIPRLERRVGTLATVAQTAPLLGLLGTVLGMIRLLAAVEQNAPLVHAGELSGGLGQALLCTAAGLAVAIPAYAAHNFLVARVESVLLDMERTAIEIAGFFGRRAPGPAETRP